MSATNVKSYWSGGDLYFADKSGNTIVQLDGTNRNIRPLGRLVAAGATLTATAEAHDGKSILLDTAAGSIVTLPAATATGARLRFQISVTATTNSHIIKVANATDEIQGLILAVQGDEANDPTQGWTAGAADDTITLNRSTTGLAAIGNYLELEDIKAGVWAVYGIIEQSGAQATPFSATVA